MRVFNLLFNFRERNLNTDTIAARIIAVRGEQSRRSFANTLEIKENTLRNYEQGLSLPNFDTISKICRLFFVSPEWLVLGKGEMKATRKEPTSEEIKIVKPDKMPDVELSLRIAKLESKLEKVEEERREVAVENRRLYSEKEGLYREKEQLLREKEELLRENGTLREKLARLGAERGKRLSDHDDEDSPSLFDEQHFTTSSSQTSRVHK